ncbi:Asp23/Gls24 family envelope stress response protein [Feifania hominis]|uniref:Asp23/Gls24 family envelope stress response protein n=1 Tax=Feifania hominis TaxID=2763660 RepID=A0A926DCF8_9FIRM|nr:Asp23/Gls24 family envelope stress response protein [Feifania hominis]
MEQNYNGTVGTVKISDDVIATIAGVAAGEVKGVAGMSAKAPAEINIKGIIGGKKNTGRGIRVTVDGGNVSIEAYIVLKFGVKIQDVATAVQEAVKNSVEEMTGYTVTNVSVYVQGVNLNEEPAEPTV